MARTFPSLAFRRQIALAILLVSCGRPSTEADVKLVGVGADPDEIGPSPTAYGGIVEYDHVDFAGAGLNLGLMGLSGVDPVGPDMADFAPPYEGIFAFSYIFDTRLPAADTLVQIGGAPPEIPDTCYTAYDPQGPIGSFTTVDVGDFMEFATADGSAGMRLGRFPTDYPPDPQDLFIYYIGFQYYTPTPLTHFVPDPNSSDPRDMTERVYRQANFPFGQEVTYRFPGGFSRFDQPVSSIPRPSEPAAITLPERLDGVILDWTGPRYDVSGEVIEEGLIRRCFEFYEGRVTDETLTLEQCNELLLPGDDIDEYRSFDGQLYTAPWDTDDGAVRFQWTPGSPGDVVSLTVRFMAPIDQNDPSYSFSAVETEGGDLRAPTACEEDRVFPFDEASFTDGAGNFVPSAQGDPQSQRIVVTCLLEDDGEFELNATEFEPALTYAESHEVGGVVFFFSRGTEAEVRVPAAKDRYDERHDITPIKVMAKTVRIGRFWWE